MTAYEILGVREDASDEEIRVAFRAAAAAAHPDRGGDIERAKLLSRAFALLKDPESRQAYDARLARTRGHVSLRFADTILADAQRRLATAQAVIRDPRVRQIDATARQVRRTAQGVGELFEALIGAVNKE